MRRNLAFHHSAAALALRICCLLLLFCGSVHAIDPLPFKDRAEEVRFQQLARQLRCLVCQNQDLADSDADLAKDLRRQVFEMMRSGKSDAQIKQYLVARYNDFVLYDPPLKPGTWLLWFLPFALLATGAVVVARIVRERIAQAAALAKAGPGAPDAGADAAGMPREPAQATARHERLPQQPGEDW